MHRINEPLPSCTVPGCDMIQYAKKLCRTHYDRLRKRGTLEPVVHRIGCDVPRCEGKHEARGMCRKHHSRWIKTKTVERDIDLSLFDRVIKRSVRESGGCLVYTGGIDLKGYGQLGGQYVHRIVWEKLKGPIPAGHYVAHELGICKIKTCVEIEHLFCASVGTMLKRMYKEGWRTPIECW